MTDAEITQSARLSMQLNPLDRIELLLSELDYYDLVSLQDTVELRIESFEDRNDGVQATPPLSDAEEEERDATAIPLPLKKRKLTEGSFAAGVEPDGGDHE